MGFEIDGAKDPSAIPDVVAYKHFFTALAKMGSGGPQDGDRRRRSYLQFFFRVDAGGQPNEDRSLTNAQVDRLLWVVDDLIPKLQTIGQEAAALKSQNASSQQLTAVKQRMDDLIARTAADLPVLVDSGTAAKVGRHIMDMKKQIKITTVRVPTSVVQ